MSQYCRMLVEYYIAALIGDESAADEVWHHWDAGLISDDLAALAWWLVAHQGSGPEDGALRTSPN